MDLFVAPTRPAELIGAARQTAVELLRVLLTEAVMAPISHPSVSNKQETGNE
jgi:hypothetical protein